MASAGDQQMFSNRSPAATWLLFVCLASCLLARTAAGSCLQYGHSCWGAHGKRSDVAPGAPAPDLAAPEMSAVQVEDAPSWVTLQDDAAAPELGEAAWQKLRRAAVIRRANHRNSQRRVETEDMETPPRWLYQLMRQAATKMD